MAGFVCVAFVVGASCGLTAAEVATGCVGTVDALPYWKDGLLSDDSTFPDISGLKPGFVLCGMIDAGIFVMSPSLKPPRPISGALGVGMLLPPV